MHGCMDTLNIVASDLVYECLWCISTPSRQCDDAVPTLLVTLKILAADPRCLQILLAEAPMVRYGFKDSNFHGEKRWPWWWSMRIGGYSIFRHSQDQPGKSIYFSCILLRLKSASCVCSISNHSQYLCGKPVGSEPAMNNSSIGLLTWAGIDGTWNGWKKDTGHHGRFP